MLIPLCTDWLCTEITRSTQAKTFTEKVFRRHLFPSLLCGLPPLLRVKLEVPESPARGSESVCFLCATIFTLRSCWLQAGPHPGTHPCPPKHCCPFTAFAKVVPPQASELLFLCLECSVHMFCSFGYLVDILIKVKPFQTDFSLASLAKIVSFHFRLSLSDTLFGFLYTTRSGYITCRIHWKNKNTRLLIQILLRILRQWEQSIKQNA